MTETNAMVRSSSEAPLAERVVWTRERIELVKRTICPTGISDDAFALFMEQCKRSGLDPLLKEAFCVPRRQKVDESWVTKHEFQPSEAGMLARAARFPDFKGIQASAVYADDEIIVDQGKSEVVHRFNPAKRKGVLVGAWARVVREGKLPVVVWLNFAGYVQGTPLWQKIPTTMIEKCARVAALRKAYPEAFGGLYIQEEMPAEPEEKPRRERKPVYGPPAGEPEDLDAVDAQFRAASEQVTGAPPPGEEETHVLTGRHKGKAIAGLDVVQLQEAVEDVGKIVNNPENRRKASYAKAARAFAALQAELAARQQTKTAEPTPEEQEAIRQHEEAPDQEAGAKW